MAKSRALTDSPCVHTPPSLDPKSTLTAIACWFGNTRFLECSMRTGGCGSSFWYDGPSILAEDDKCRKRAFTGNIIELDEFSVDMVKRT